MADRIFTLGCEALSLNIFIARLKEAGVETVIDVRANLSTPEEKCIGFPEQKYISEAGKKGR